MYMSYMGSADNIWDQTADEDSGKTYGDQAVESSLKSVETMYILKEKAADYKVEVTEDEEKAIADAASQFMASNGEDTIKEAWSYRGSGKDSVRASTQFRRRFMILLLRRAILQFPMMKQISTSFTYVSISTSGDDVTDEQKEEKKKQAQEILDKMERRSYC